MSDDDDDENDEPHVREIADAYAELASVLGIEAAGGYPTPAFAHVVQREVLVDPTPMGRRGFLAYLRWCIAHPDKILAAEPVSECPCRGSGWLSDDDGNVRPCPDHEPRVNERHGPTDAQREVAAAGREIDERRYR